MTSAMRARVPGVVFSGRASREKKSCRWAAQARKYGLGMIFATQLPKGIDNRIVSNCTTHVTSFNRPDVA